MSYSMWRRRKVAKLITFSDAEWSRIEKAYQHHNRNKRYKNITEYMREIIINGHVKQVVTLVNTDDFSRTMSGIGTNINQIAHMANMKQSVSEQQIQEVLAQLAQLRNIFAQWQLMWNEEQA